MMLDGFISLITNDPGCAALMANRHYKSVLPRGYKLPASAIHRYGGTQDYQFDGPVEIREDQIQIDVYADKAETAQAAVEAVRTLLVGFTGALPDGTVIQACYLERDMDLPFLPHADSQGIANRSCLGFRVISSR